MLTHRLNTGFATAVLILLAVQAYFNVVSWWWLAIPIVLWLVFAVAGSGLVQSGYHLKTLNRQKPVTGRQIALTFDDGPTPYTEKVLELLDRYNAKATFFCIGTQVEKYPHILKKIVDGGHTVGNHSYSHSNKMAIFPVTKIVEEIKHTNALIQQHTHRQTVLYRPPFGVTSPNIAKALRQTGHYVIGWNIRSLDAVIDNETRILNRIKKRLNAGGIILLHDTSQKSVNVLEQLLLLLQQENYKVVQTGQLLNIPAYEE